MINRTSTLSDEELAVRSLTKQEFFNELVHRYSEKIWRYTARLIGNREEAEDVTQEVFFKAYVNLASFNPKLKFSSWVYRIAHNEAVNYIKKHYRYKRVEFNESIAHELFDAHTALDKLIQIDNKDLVAKAMGQLKVREKDLLELAFFEQKSYIEISDILQVSINSVGPLINRAKSHLKKILIEMRHDDKH